MKNEQLHTDEILMLQVKDDNLDSLSPLFEKYHVRLYNYFLNRVRDKMVSEDLVQNVFRRILSYRHTYNENWKFVSWMYQIARNVMNNHFNESKLVISDYTDVELESSQTTEENSDNTDKQHTLHSAILKLDEEQRYIIELSKLQGLKYQQIADITGNSVPAIKVKVHRAMKKLKQIYFDIA